MTSTTSTPTNSPSLLRGADHLFIILTMGLMGAFFWAIRGTGGFGGSNGGALAGLGWAALWLLFSNIGGAPRQRPYGTGYIIAAITFGIAFGGLTGYGVYIGWLKGQFYLDHPEGLRAIAPWTGYAMLFFCGLHWGGIAGAFMAWCAPRKPVTLATWTARIAAGVCGALAAGFIVRTFPQLFLPFYDEGLYTIAANKTCIRALNSIQTIAPHVGLFFGFLCFEIARRDWRAAAMMTLMALGFAIPFTIGGYWQTLHEAQLKLDWWKHWEMTIGLGGGLTFGLAFYLFNQPKNQGLTQAQARPEGRGEDVSVPGFSPPGDAAGNGDLTQAQARPEGRGEDLSVPGFSPPLTTNECIWGAGFPIWLAGGIIFTGAYKGFYDHHQLQWPSTVFVALTAAYVFIATNMYARWIAKARKIGRGGEAAPITQPIPTWTLIAALALIIAAGAITSIPPEMRLANAELLALYAGYLIISLALTGALAHRVNKRKP